MFFDYKATRYLLILLGTFLILLLLLGSLYFFLPRPSSNPHYFEDASGNLFYQSDTLSVKLEHFTQTAPNLDYWLGTIQITDTTQIKSAFAYDTFSNTRKQWVSTMAKNNDAVLAINGSATGFSEKGIVIRNGIVYRDEVFDCAPLEIRNDGSLFIGDYAKRTVRQMLADGTLHTFDFCPDLIVDGEISNFTYYDWFHTDRAPRTAIGQIRPYEYIILVVDGRSERSIGMSFQDLADIFLRLGCKWAYALDGGGSTTLYFNKQVLNRPSQIIQRPYSDILYFTD